MGSVASCRKMVDAVRLAGVDEIACLIDFGLPPDRIMGSLECVDQLRREKAAS